VSKNARCLVTSQDGVGEGAVWLISLYEMPGKLGGTPLDTSR
jgi:hypothetical protein